MKSIHWCFWALRPVVSSYLLLLRLLTPITVLRSSTIVAQTWTRRFTIALSSDSFLPAERACRLRGLSPQHRGRINNRELSLWIEGPGSIAHMGTDRSSDGWSIDTGGAVRFRGAPSVRTTSGTAALFPASVRGGGRVPSAPG